MRVALYCRVSRKEQNEAMQITACKKYCAEKDYTIHGTYIDKSTGRNTRRPRFEQMRKDALYRKFSVVIVWKMDRLTRGTIKEVHEILGEFRRFNVVVESVTEPFLNTDNPSWDLILSVMAWCANMESKRIGERVTAGIDNWKEKNPGKRWSGKDWDIYKAIVLRQQGLGWRSIEKCLREQGADISWAGIRKELLKRDINSPAEKHTQDSDPDL